MGTLPGDARRARRGSPRVTRRRIGAVAIRWVLDQPGVVGRDRRRAARAAPRATIRRPARSTLDDKDRADDRARPGASAGPERRRLLPRARQGRPARVDHAVRASGIVGRGSSPPELNRPPRPRRVTLFAIPGGQRCRDFCVSRCFFRSPRSPPGCSLKHRPSEESFRSTRTQRATRISRWSPSRRTASSSSPGRAGSGRLGARHLRPALRRQRREERIGDRGQRVYDGRANSVNVAAGNDGNFVVTWHSKQDDSVIWNRCEKISPRQQRGPEFIVNTYTTGGQYQPAVAMGGDSSFVVVWGSDYPTDQMGIFGQRFGPTLGSAVGSEFPVKAGTRGRYFRQSPWTNPANSSPSGRMTRASAVLGSSDNGSTPPARKSEPFFPSTRTRPAIKALPTVTMGKHGDFVVVWSDYSGEDGDEGGVFGQRFDVSGEKVGSEFQVNTYTTGFQYGPAVAMDSRGGFVVIWYNGGLFDAPGGIAGQKFDRTGAKVGSEFAVNTSTTGLVYPALERLVRRNRCLRRGLGTPGADGDNAASFELAPIPCRARCGWTRTAPPERRPT